MWVSHKAQFLGPLLFLLYTNDLPMHVSRCNLFADDTLIYCSGATVTESAAKLQEELHKVHNWFVSNKLTLNINKSNTMVIGTRQRIGDSASKESLGITINGIQLKNCCEYTYLGLTIDSHLSWNAQVEKVCKKLGSRVAMLQRMRGTFSSAQLNTLYFSFVQPHVDYALSVWGNTTQQNLQRVQRHLNRSARIVSNNFDFDVPSLSIIESQTILDFGKS